MPQIVSTRLQQIAEQAVSYPEIVFLSLAHLIDVEFLSEAYKQVRKDGASGVDGVTAEEYAENLEVNLANLHERLRDYKYIAPLVKRIWLDKEDGSKRPIGIPCLEDKIVQRAVIMLLNPIYEQVFYDFSYGFREGRGPHQALRELREKLYEMRVHWIVDADVSGFFDNLDHKILKEFLQQRVADGSILRLIGKWLNAGVLDGKEEFYPEKGTPQGGVVSPLLANIFLHYTLDEWFVKTVKPRMKGKCFLIRFADDFIIGCELEEDARRIEAVLPKRFNRFGLTIHPEKTKLVEFINPELRKNTGSEYSTFNFLGFTHYWSKSRKGNWVVKRKTMRKRLRRTMKAIWTWCCYNRHLDITEQYRKLCAKLRGHYNYFGIRCNYKMLELVMEHAEKAWRRWLGRRTRNGKISFERFKQIKEIFPLPKPRIVHNI